MLWWMGVALAAAPVDVEQSHLVAAEPDVVRAVLADLANWPAIWDLKSAEDTSRQHVRGETQTTRQLLAWSTAEKARGRMTLDEVEDLRVDYSVDWSSVGVTRARPPSHSGSLALTAEAGGTRVSWTAALDKRAADRLERQMVTSLEVLAALSEQGTPPAREPRVVQWSPAVFAWQGFHHRWTYNHRINRSGDWWTVPVCAEDTCTASQVHAAASGSGVDRATFDGFGSSLVGADVGGWYGSLSLWFDGKEGEELTDRVCMRIGDEVGEGPVMLRGYDLDAVESADSLWAVRLDVLREDGEVCAEATIRMDCKTPECGSERLTTYSMEVPFVVATGPLTWTNHEVARTQIWQAKDIRDEPVPAPISQTLPAESDRAALVGLSGFAVELDAPLHTLGLDVALRPTAVVEQGVELEVDLFYGQWGPVEIAPMTVAQFAHEGRALLSADLVLVQAEAGCVKTAATSGTTFWPGKQADASVPEAEHQSDHSFGAFCEPGSGDGAPE